MNNNASKYVCPKCGFSIPYDSNEYVNIFGATDAKGACLDGRYCIKCYVRWIASNVHRMEYIADTECGGNKSSWYKKLLRKLWR